jgi:DNA invertase Pin-like site-specific DNA recombinase
MTTQKRAWIYTRIDAPEDTHSKLKGQEKELMDYAERLGFSVIGGSSDLGNGLDADSPGVNSLITAAEQDRFDVLLVKSASRLGRDAVTLNVILEELRQFDVEIFSPLEGNLNAAIPYPSAQTAKSGDAKMGGHRHE